MWHPDTPPEYRNEIVTGDARLLAERIPDESVDVIACDPVYWNLEDYFWLGGLARRVLKPDGVALVWTGTIYERACLSALEVNLRYRLTLNYIRVGNTAMSGALKTFLWRSPLLWMGNGNPNKWIPDTIVSTNATNGTHKWNKNPEAITSWLDAFTQSVSIIFDPFAGGGTVPAVCKILNRNYIAFEIDPDTATRARARVNQTQAMEPVFLGIQEELSFT